MSTSCREYIKRLEKENKLLRQQLTKEKEEKKKIIKIFSNTQKTSVPNSICDLH